MGAWVSVRIGFSCHCLVRCTLSSDPQPYQSNANIPFEVGLDEPQRTRFRLRRPNLCSRISTWAS